VAKNSNRHPCHSLSLCLRHPYLGGSCGSGSGSPNSCSWGVTGAALPAGPAGAGGAATEVLLWGALEGTGFSVGPFPQSCLEGLSRTRQKLGCQSERDPDPTSVTLTKLASIWGILLLCKRLRDKDFRGQVETE
jgi:hypothetical protein